MFIHGNWANKTCRIWACLDCFFFFFFSPQRHQSFMHGEDLCPFPLLFFFFFFFYPCMDFISFFFSLYVSILLIIHKCPLSLPFPFPLLSSPVAIIEPTTTSASSPGQYMSPCCTQNQKRGPAPHTNPSWKPLLHLWFVTIGWMECLLGVQLHHLSSLYLICTFILLFIFFLVVVVVDFLKYFFIFLGSTAWLNILPVACAIMPHSSCLPSLQPRRHQRHAE